jgi:hypothetical protein
MQRFQLLGGQRLKSIIFRHGAGSLHPRSPLRADLTRRVHADHVQFPHRSAARENDVSRGSRGPVFLFSREYPSRAHGGRADSRRGTFA